MKRIISIYILMIFSIAVQGHPLFNPAEKPDVKKQAVIEYVSLVNDFASITMELYDNGKFALFIEPKEGKSLKLKGSWEKNKNFYVLKFKRTQLAVDKLFNMNDPNRFEMLTEQEIKFSEHLSSLWIWGIQCKKSDEATVIASSK